MDALENVVRIVSWENRLQNIHRYYGTYSFITGAHCYGWFTPFHNIYGAPAHAHLYFRALGIATQETKQQKKMGLGEDGLMGGRLNEVMVDGEAEGSEGSSREH